jgi:hypothetical protein
MLYELELALLKGENGVWWEAIKDCEANDAGRGTSETR